MDWIQRIPHRLAALLICAAVFAGTALSAGFFHRSTPPTGIPLNTSGGYYCALRAQGLPEGSIVTVCTDTGSVLHTVAMFDGEALIGPLAPEQAYSLLLPDGAQGCFYLAANASVHAQSSTLRDDGELLYYATTLDLLAALPEWNSALRSE